MPLAPRSDRAAVGRGELAGRERELSRLLDGIARDVTSGLPGITFIWAPAGAGKTRLVRCAASGSDAEFVLIEADGSPGDDPFAAFVRSWFGTTGGIGEARGAETFNALWDGLMLRLELEGGPLGRLRDTLRRTRPFLREIAIPTARPEASDPSVLAAGRRSALACFLTSLSVSQSVVVVLENLHWLSAEGLETAQELFRSSSGFPVSFIATSRPSPDGSMPSFPSSPSLGRTETMELTGLPRESIPGLVTGLTGLDPTEDAIALLWEWTGGIPLLLEHAVLFLIESASASGDEGRMALTAGAHPVHGDLGDPLAARIRLLPEPLLPVLRGAAILGGAFGMESLDALTGIDTGPAVREAIRKHFFIAEAGKLSFSHELVREAVLESCPPAESGRLHLAAAALLETSGEPAIPGMLERIGTHFLLGGDTVRAADYLLRAAEDYASVFDNDAAESMYRRAAVLLPEPGRTVAELALVEVHKNAGLMNRSVDLLTATLDRIAVHPAVDRSLRMRVCMKLGMNLIVVGRTAEGERLLNESLAFFREAGETADTAAALRHLGIAAHFTGRAGEALERLGASLDLSRETGDPAAICSSLYWLAIACRETGRLDQLRSLTEEQVALARETGLVQSLIGGYDNLMRLHIYTTDFDSAEAVHGELRAAAEVSGNWAALSAASSKMGIIHLKREEWAKADECFRRCVVLTERTGNLRARCVALGNLAHAAIEMGKLDDAMEHAMTMINASLSVGFRLGVMSGYARMAYILIQRGSYEAAMDCIETQMEHAVLLGDSRNLSDGHATLARIFHVLDQPGEALEAVERALVSSSDAGDVRLRSGQLELKGKLLVLLGRPEEASRILEEAMELIAAQEGREKAAFCSRLYLEAARADLGDTGAPDRMLAMARHAFDDVVLGELFYQHWRVTASESSAIEARRLVALENARIPQPLLASRLSQLWGHIT